MAASAIRWFIFAAILTAALWLRTHDLCRRPMHSDEANQAVKFGELLDHGRYAIDPRDHHGPTLYYAALPIAWLRGQHTLASLDEVTVRLVPALAGTLAVALLVVVCTPLGRWPALAAGAFLAVSPPAVYYSRYFIQETLLAAFALFALAAAIRWWQTGRLRWALVAGAGIGLMFATKATAPLFIVAAALGAWVVRPARPASPRVRRDATLAIAAALLTAVVLLSSFLTHFSGLRDAVAAYGFGATRATAGSGHEKPWWYYLQMFGLEHRGGLVWQQFGFSALALCGAALAVLDWWVRRTAESTRPPDCRPSDHGPRPHSLTNAPSEQRHVLRDTSLRTTPEGERGVCHTLYDKPEHPAAAADARRVMIGALAYTVLVAATLSATPYKTPWHVIHFVPGLCVLAAGVLTMLPRVRMAFLFAALVIVMQASQTRLAVFQRPADERNPYAYVHSSPDVLKVRPLVEAAIAAHPSLPVRVIGDEYWPIPWYVRGLDHIGYWNIAPADCDGALVIASGSQVDSVRARLRGRYRESLLGLRPDLLCVVFTPVP